MLKRMILLPLAALMLPVGCANVPHDAGFADVQKQVLARTGRRVDWYRDSKEDAKAAHAIDQLLQHPLTVDAAVQVTLLSNRNLQATYEDLGVAQAAVVQAGLLKNPVFDFSAGFISGGGSPALSVGVAEDFLSVFYRPLHQAVAKADFERAKLHVTSAVLDLAAETRRTFYQVQANEQMLQMRQQIADATAASVDAAQRLHEAGNTRDIDLHNEQAMHDQSLLDLTAAQTELAGSRERLNRLMGLWGKQAEQWKVQPRMADVPKDAMKLDQVESQAVANSLDLAMARQDIEAFGHRLGLAKDAALIPELDLGGQATWDRREQPAWDSGPTVSLPIPLLDQGQARVATAKAELQHRRQVYFALAVEVRSAAREARVQLVQARRTAEYYRTTILPLRSEILHETQLNYNAMQVGVFQLLLARQQQIDAGQRDIQALRDYWIARTNLDTILHGRLTMPSGAGNIPSSMNMPAMSGAHDHTGGL